MRKYGEEVPFTEVKEVSRIVSTFQEIKVIQNNKKLDICLVNIYHLCQIVNLI